MENERKHNTTKMRENSVRSYKRHDVSNCITGKSTVSSTISKIWSVLEYECEAWNPRLTDYLHRDIETIQVKVLWIIFSHNISYQDALERANIPVLKDRRNTLCLKFAKGMENVQKQLHTLLLAKRTYRYHLRRQPSYEPARGGGY